MLRLAGRGAVRRGITSIKEDSSLRIAKVLVPTRTASGPLPAKMRRKTRTCSPGTKPNSIKRRRKAPPSWAPGRMPLDGRQGAHGQLVQGGGRGLGGRVMGVVRFHGLILRLNANNSQ